MNDVERQKLAQQATELMTYWVEVLQLDHWRIELQICDEIEPSEALASCSPHEYAESAIVRLATDWEERADSDQTLEYIVVHELLHIHLRDLDETFLGAVGNLGIIGQGYHRAWSRAEEGLIDRVTHAFLDLNSTKVVSFESND